MSANRERAERCWVEMSLGNIARPGNGKMVADIIERAIDAACAEAVAAERSACEKLCADMAEKAGKHANQDDIDDADMHAVTVASALAWQIKSRSSVPK